MTRKPEGIRMQASVASSTPRNSLCIKHTDSAGRSRSHAHKVCVVAVHLATTPEGSGRPCARAGNQQQPCNQLACSA